MRFPFRRPRKAVADWFCLADPALLRFLAFGLLVLAAQIHATAQSSRALASPPPLTLDAYLAELDRVGAFLGSSTAPGAEAMSSGVSPRWVVDVKGDRVAVDMRWLVAGLREASEPGVDWMVTRERLRGRLRALRAHASEMSAAADPPYGAFRSAIADVLQGPEFQRRRPGWLERVQQWLGEWVQALFKRVGLGGVAGRSLAVAFAWIAALTALGGLGIWLVRVLGAGSPGVSFRLAPDERRVSAREWALRAKRAIAEGNAREAVRCAYNGALRRLEEEGAWRLDPSRTPREYLRLLKPGDSRTRAVTDLTQAFEQVWYASRAVDAAAMDRVRANLENLGCLQPSDRTI